MKRNILLPYNFSEVGNNALKFAFKLFGEGAHFTVFHAVTGMLNTEDATILSPGMTKLESVKKAINDNISSLQKELGMEIDFEIKTEYGNVVDSILKCKEKGSYECILMGTRDKYDLFDKILGTVSLGVVKRSDLPVYLIPPGSEFTTFEKVVVASDFHLESDKILDGIKSWNCEFNADLHFFHIEKDEKKEKPEFVKNIIEEYIENESVDFPFTVTVEKNSNITRGILEYTENEKANLQIIITDHTTWLNTITSDGITKNLILKSKTPMLFLNSGWVKTSKIFFELIA